MNEIDEVVNMLLDGIKAAAVRDDLLGVDCYSSAYLRIASVAKNEVVKNQVSILSLLAKALITSIYSNDHEAIDTYSKAIQRILSSQ